MATLKRTSETRTTDVHVSADGANALRLALARAMMPRVLEAHGKALKQWNDPLVLVLDEDDVIGRAVVDSTGLARGQGIYVVGAPACEVVTSLEHVLASDITRRLKTLQQDMLHVLVIAHQGAMVWTPTRTQALGPVPCP